MRDPDFDNLYLDANNLIEAGDTRDILLIVRKLWDEAKLAKQALKQENIESMDRANLAIVATREENNRILQMLKPAHILPLVDLDGVRAMPIVTISWKSKNNSAWKVLLRESLVTISRAQVGTPSLYYDSLVTSWLAFNNAQPMLAPPLPTDLTCH